MKKVLVIDDEKALRTRLSELLKKDGFGVLEASSGKEGLDLFKKRRPDAVLLDYRMPGMDLIETLGALRETDPDVPVIIVTEHEDVHLAVEAIKAGAYDFITRPAGTDALLMTIKRGIEKLELERKVRKLNTAVGGSIEYIFGKSGPVRKVIREITRVASSDFSVIIQGETGTGKSIVAEVIHNMSTRADETFIRVDLGAIPETLVESELFGYEKGAFTGADKSRKGYFLAANKGTIFIDELENSSSAVQSKLLGVAEQRQVYPVGGVKPLAVDVRIISATNTDLRDLVGRKKFREDLFFRLGEFMIKLPPLRERIEDIAFLAQRFCREACSELHKPAARLLDSTIDLLSHHPWPGNVRELKNVIRRAVLLSNSTSIAPENIDFLSTGSPGEVPSGPILPLKDISSMAIRYAEKTAIARALEISGGNKTTTASMLKVDYKTLLTKIKLYHIA